LNVLSVVPFNVIPPPSAVTSVGLLTTPISMFLSLTLRVVLSIVVVVPCTVKLPDITTFWLLSILIASVPAVIKDNSLAAALAIPVSTSLLNVKTGLVDEGVSSRIEGPLVSEPLKWPPSKKNLLFKSNS